MQTLPRRKVPKREMQRLPEKVWYPSPDGQSVKRLWRNLIGSQSWKTLFSIKLRFVPAHHSVRRDICHCSTFQESGISFAYSPGLKESGDPAQEWNNDFFPAFLREASV